MKKGIDTISKEDFIKGVSGIVAFGTSKDKVVPATFPVKLPRLLIELLSFKGDIVLDPFMGSGSTAIAALMTGRKFIGIEISEKYWRYACQRLSEDLIFST